MKKDNNRIKALMLSSFIFLSVYSFAFLLVRVETQKSYLFPFAVHGYIATTLSNSVNSKNANTVIAVANGDIEQPLTEDSPLVTSIVLVPGAATITTGYNMTLGYLISPRIASKSEITWYSDNPAVAEVNEKGTVTGISEGTATIYAMPVDQSVFASAVITVKGTEMSTYGPEPASSIEEHSVYSSEELTDIPVTGVVITPAEATLNVNETIYLIANILPENATNKKITWSSSDSSIVSVTSDGVVTGKFPGVAEIKATSEDGNIVGSSIITVTEVERSSKEEYAYIKPADLDDDESTSKLLLIGGIILSIFVLAGIAYVVTKSVKQKSE